MEIGEKSFFSNFDYMKLFNNKYWVFRRKFRPKFPIFDPSTSVKLTTALHGDSFVRFLWAWKPNVLN